MGTRRTRLFRRTSAKRRVTRDRSPNATGQSEVYRPKEGRFRHARSLTFIITLNLSRKASPLSLVHSASLGSLSMQRDGANEELRKF
jgi:hypothetical protein